MMEYCPHCMAPNVTGHFCPHCGGDLTWTGQQGLELPVGTHLTGEGGLRRYWLGATLGKGGFGITYRAIEIASHRRMAIKEYFPTQCSFRSSDGITVQTFDEQAQNFYTGMTSFLKEARMLLSQEDLPSVVRVIDFFQANGTAYLVMEYLDGLPLHAYTKTRGGTIPAQELLQKLEPVIRDLGILHQRGILHRDISPDNLMWMPNNTIKVMDFGSARSMESGKSMTMLLKEGFSPVEQYRSTGQGPYTDIYALSATIYYCITGVIPQSSLDRREEDTLRPPTELGANLTVQQENALLWGLSVLPNARPQSMADFYRALYHGAISAQPQPPRTTPAQTPSVPSSQTPPMPSSQRPPVQVPPVRPSQAPAGPSSQRQSVHPSQTSAVPQYQAPPVQSSPRQSSSPYETKPLHPPAAPPPSQQRKKKLPVLPIAIGAVLAIIVVAVLAITIFGRGGRDPATLESRLPATTTPTNRPAGTDAPVHASDSAETAEPPAVTPSPADPDDTDEPSAILPEDTQPPAEPSGDSNGSTTTNPPTTNPPATNPPVGPSGTSELAGHYMLTIWVPSNTVDLTKSQIDAFNSSNTMGIVIEATVEPVSEADAATNMISDVSAGADLFFFAQDQLSRMIQAGAVSKLGQGAAAFVRDNNTVGSLIAAQAGSDFYAYPLTADNGYLMYYDRSVIPEEDVDSFEKLIEDCEKAGKFFSYNLENSWYSAGVFFGTGCHSDWVTDNEGNFISIDDDFYSDKGLIAAKAIYKLVSSSCYLNSADQMGFANGCAVIVTGTWSYAKILETLGDNMGTADLPSFIVDGQEYHLGSYRGCKLLGVKPQTDPKLGAVANQLAQYLTNKECQLQRVETLGWGPSNIEASSDPITLANPAITALNLQNEHSVMQPNIHGSWWDIADTLIKDIKDSDGSDSALRAALQKYSDGLQAVFTIPNDVKYAWTVIGSIGGSDWDYDFEMTKSGNIWTSNDIFDLNAGDEFKVRQGKNWDVSYGDGGNNFVVKTAGTYYIQFNEATGGVSLVPA